MRRPAARALAAMTGLLVSACNPVAPAQDDRIIRWLECEECDRGQLDSVVAIGQPAVPALAHYLHDGPPQVRIDSLLAHLRRGHGLVDSYHVHVDTTAGSVSDSARYVSRYVNNYIATYRSRSARALGMIGGADARAALDSALQLPLRGDVKFQIQYAIDSLWTP